MAWNHAKFHREYRHRALPFNSVSKFTPELMIDFISHVQTPAIYIYFLYPIFSDLKQIFTYSRILCI